VRASAECGWRVVVRKMDLGTGQTRVGLGSWDSMVPVVILQAITAADYSTGPPSKCLVVQAGVLDGPIEVFPGQGSNIVEFSNWPNDYRQISAHKL